MCGITTIWNRELSFPSEIVDHLFSSAVNRGEDGYGIFITDLVKKITARSLDYYKGLGTLGWTKGDIILANFRAQPETEVESSLQDLQPILRDSCVLVHNGVVSEEIVNKYRDQMQTNIDSEVIILEYLNNKKDMKKTMESLTGGFAFLMLDMEEKKLFAVNDFKPLAVGYVKSWGMIFHSLLEPVKKAVKNVALINGENLESVWKNYYYEWQDGFTIREIDLETGIQKFQNFTPNYFIPARKKETNKIKTLVSASGGIDSGLTAYILKKLGYNVELIFFDYGQKSRLSEEWGVRKLSENINAPMRKVDISYLYEDSVSSLVSESVKIDSGSENRLKSVTAWVECRNFVFLSIMTLFAERYLINGYREVKICAGFPQLTESGIFPDNSEYFMRTFMNVVKYGTLFPDKIKFVNLMQNIMKAEEWILGSEIGFDFSETVSCDFAKYVPKEDQVYLCRQCGSTLLSMWAAEMAGVEDPRKFYDREVGFKLYPKKFSGKTKKIDFIDVIQRLEGISGEEKHTLELLSVPGLSESIKEVRKEINRG